MARTEPEFLGSAGPPEGAPSAGSSEFASPPAILRLESGALAQVIDSLADPSVLAAGQVTVISLDGIAERFGPRWSLRRDLVYQQVERVLERLLGLEAVVHRIAETQYVVVQPRQSRLVAQGLCLRCLKEILHHFLGEVVPADIRLHEVTRMSPDGIYGHTVDLPPVDAGPGLGDGEPANFAQPQRAGPAEPSATAREPPFVSQWTPFVASDGRGLRVSCALEPVVHLASSARIGFRLARRVLDLQTERPLSALELQNLSRADIATVDYATIARGLHRLRAEGDGGKMPTLIVPVSYATLSNQRTRERLVALLQEAKAEVRLGLVCEICDIEGVPPGALLTAVSLITPFCMRVLAFLSDPRPPLLRPLKGLGLHGVSMNCPAGLGDAEFVGWIREAKAASRLVANTLFLYRVPSTQRGALAFLAGVTHLSMASAPTRTLLI